MDSAKENIENASRRYLWHGKDHDDLCFACGNPGELLECDDCPRVYHLVCIGLEDVPSDKYSCPWHVCSECQRFTYADASLAVACCCACSTCYCIPCAPASVQSRFSNPNLAHMSSKSDLNTYLVDIHSAGSSIDKDLISNDYLTDGGAWCSSYLPKGSVVYLCSSCEVNAAQDDGDIFQNKSRDAVLNSTSSQNTNFLPSHRLLEAFLGTPVPAQNSNGSFFPSTVDNPVNALRTEAVNVVVAHAQCLDKTTVMDVVNPNETLPFVKIEAAELTEQRAITELEFSNVNTDIGLLSHTQTHRDDGTETVIKDELGEPSIFVDNDSKMAEFPPAGAELNDSGTALSESLLVYGKCDPQIDLEALKDTPIVCVRVGENTPLYRWKNVQTACNDLGQDVGFVRIAAHSFERFKLNIDDKVKLAFGLVWRHCDIQEYTNAFENLPALHLSVIRQEIKTFWLQRAVIAEQKQDYSTAKKSLEYMRAVPGGLTLEMSSIQYRISTEALKHGESELGLESFPVDIYHEDSQQFMHRFESLTDAITILNLQEIARIPLAELQEKLLLTISGDAKEKLKRSPYFCAFWFSAVDDGFLKSLASGKIKNLPLDASLRPAPPNEKWFGIAEINKIINAQFNAPTRSLAALRKEQNLLKSHRNVVSANSQSEAEPPSESNSQMRALQVAHSLKMIKYYERREISDLLNDLTMIVYFSDRDKDVENPLHVYNPMLSLNPDGVRPPEPQLVSSESGVECISKHDMRTLGVVQNCVEAAAVCKSSVASVYNSVRSGLSLGCGGFLWRNTSQVPGRYFRVPFRRAELSSNSFPRLPAIRSIPAKIPPTGEVVANLLVGNPAENVNEMDGSAEISALPVPLEDETAGQLMARGRRKYVDIRSHIDGPVLRRFSSGSEASGVLLVNQTQVSQACCTNARKISKGQPLGKSLGLIFTFSDDTHLSSAQGAQIEVQNLDQQVLIGLLEGFRRKRKTGRARGSAEMSSGDDSGNDNDEVERSRGKRRRKRPQHDDMFISTDAAMVYVDHYEAMGPTRRKPTSAYSDNTTFMSDEVNSRTLSTQETERKSDGPQKPAPGSSFMLYTERRLPVIGRSHQANIPTMLNQRMDTEDSEPDDADLTDSGHNHTLESVLSGNFDDSAVGLGREILHRLICSQYIPGLLVHLGMESAGVGEMSVGVVIEEPTIGGTIKLSDGRITHEVPTSVIQQVVPLDKILRCCNQMLKSKSALDEAELVRQIRDLASQARSRQLVTSQILHFFDAVEQFGSNIQQVFRALRPLTARTCSASTIKSDGVDDNAVEKDSEAQLQNPELSLPVSPKRPRVPDEPCADAVSPTLSLASQAARSKDATRAPDVKEVISLFHLLKNILPCRQHEDEFHALRAEIRVLSDSDSAQNSAGVASVSQEVMVFAMKDAQQKVRRAQVLSAYALAEKMNSGLL